jgi:hypothetical protein
MIDEADTFDCVERKALVGVRKRKKGAKSGVIAETARQDIGKDRRAADEMMLLEHHAGTSTMFAKAAAACDVTEPSACDAPFRRTHQSVQRAQ